MIDKKTLLEISALKPEKLDNARMNQNDQYIGLIYRGGASDFIVKPIDKDYLTYRINKYL